MAHLIDTLNDVPMAQAQQELQEAHDFLVRCAQAHHESAGETATWGIKTKRLPVPLDSPGRPRLVANATEKMVELVNMVATLERLLDALAWFESQDEFASLQVLKCHPSTSSGGNDLVLGAEAGREAVLCEVSDVVTKSDGNGKANKDIKSLRDAWQRLDKRPRCFLCLSSELSSGVQNRSAESLGCTVTERKGGEGLETTLLEITWPE